MADVSIDFQALNRMAATMKRSAVEVDGLDDRAEEVAQQLEEPFAGEWRLAEVLRDVADDWAFARRALVRRLVAASIAMDEVGEAWSGWDAAAASSQEMPRRASGGVAGAAAGAGS